MMRLTFIGSLLLMALLVSLSGCSEEAPSPKKATVKKTQQRVPEKKQVLQPEPPEPEPAAPAYVYDSTGRRDPFLPLMQIRTPVANAGQPLTPLQKFDLGQFRLIGVITGRNEPMAMVMAPGGKAYVLKRGVKIGKNDGRVTDIRDDTVVIEERFYDFAGQYRTSIQEIQLPKSQGV